MTEHFLHIGKEFGDGQYVKFEMVPTNVGFIVHAPGVIPFGAANVREAKSVLYSLLCKEQED